MICHGKRGAQREWYLHLELCRGSGGERWRGAWLVNGGVKPMFHQRKAAIGWDE